MSQILTRSQPHTISDTPCVKVSFEKLLSSEGDCYSDLAMMRWEDDGGAQTDQVSSHLRTNGRYIKVLEFPRWLRSSGNDLIEEVFSEVETHLLMTQQPWVVLDLSHVTIAGAAFVNRLVRSRSSIDSAATNVVIAGECGGVLTLFHMDRLFTMLPTREQAVEYCRRQSR